MKEIWKDIIGFEGLYQISNFGRVKTLPKYTYSKGYPQLRKEKILKIGYTGKYRCYATVKLNDKKNYKVHRLVAEAFIPNPNNLPQVNHKDENPKNNCVNNLEWCTNKYNVKYSAKPLSAEHKEKLSLAHKGKVLSQEHKNKIGDATKRRFENPHERKKQSDIITAWWKNRRKGNDE